MNQRHAICVSRLRHQEYMGMVLYWRKAWHTRKPSGWVVLGIKMRPVGLQKAKERIAYEVQNDKGNAKRKAKTVIHTERPSIH